MKTSKPTLAKKTALTLRRCPAGVHQALKQRAKANRRSLNNEALTWLEKQAASGPRLTPAKEAATILRQFEAMTTREERRQMAEAIEQIRRKMNDERLH